MKPRVHYPMVSILIPCYASQDYVGEAIQAALSQSYGHIEIIIAPDDGETYAYLRDMFKSPQLRIIPPGPKRGTGAGATRNRAIDVSTGEYLTMLDSDDVIPENYIADLMRVAMIEGAAVGPISYQDWESGNVIRVPPVFSPVLSLSGFGQLLASMHPLIHRSLEPGYVDGFAEDVIHDGHVIAKLGMIQVVKSAIYEARIRAGSTCNHGADREREIQAMYHQRIEAILRHPTSLGLQCLSRADRDDFARLFRFRAMASRAFARSGYASYDQWVAGCEAALWDQFMRTDIARGTLVIGDPPGIHP
ncbi:glycosyltransferase [Duganella sp. FT94W]|uniref:Glycosyltransferase n=1 Tax=Duganella lactea TaxID=2692173 RepID=A0ABW9V8D1_9BURK|nr:glycosyltransferase family 2 protein [Duganella lactea]MYM34959.1 glycosyltransferase [Duganella lactea]